MKIYSKEPGIIEAAEHHLAQSRLGSNPRNKMFADSQGIQMFTTLIDYAKELEVKLKVMLSTYVSKATPEEQEQTRELMRKQVSVIYEQQKIEVPIQHVKIRCGCNKFVGWMWMYRCLYCGVWFCKECAEQHFGMKVPEPFEGVAR